MTSIDHATAARIFLFIGALNALLVVIAGAYGAHAFDAQGMADRAALFQTAVQYRMFHALGLLIVGTLTTRRAKWSFLWAGGLMLAGIVLFCGSLYVTAVTGYRLATAPVGGVAFMTAWLLFAIGASKSQETATK